MVGGKTAGLVGMKNLGNTCFLNATLQCLINTEELALYFLNGDYKGAINRRGGLKGQLTEAFAEVVLKVWKEKSGSMAPTRFKSAAGNWATAFSGYSQHDAQEFLRFVLDGMHEEMNRVQHAARYEELKDIPGERDEDCATRWWHYYRSRTDSLISDVFGGQLCSHVVCCKCKHVSKAFDPFMDLSLTIPKRSGRNGQLRIEDCLQRFTEQETLTGANAFFCKNCKKQRECVRKMSLYRPSNVLVLHLKRFAFSSSLRGKLGDDVQFPTTGLDIQPFMNPEVGGRPVLYDLYGVVNHMGGMGGGHYTANVKNCVDGCWYTMDDSHVSKVNESRIFGPQAYMLFYKRVA
jgi:ubiquitin C-terminal hydrolase